MRYLTSHTTRYLYQEPVSQCLSEARLIPRSMPGQRVLASRIHVEPEPAVIDNRKDYFGNDVSSFAIFRNHDRFITTATGVVEVEASLLSSPALAWERVRDLVAAHASDESLAAYEFVFDSPYAAAARELADFARSTFTPGRPYAEAARELSHRIHDEFTYLPTSSSINMPLLEVFHNRCGVCQDFAHIMIGALRSLCLPARYVSGYLRSGAQYQGAEASHAWVSVFVPETGWLSFDPTNDVVPSDGHVTLAWGRDYGDVTPVKGIALGGGHQTVEVEVRVVPAERPSGCFGAQ
ncbi:MAG TPA: transglutaminase family protein [Bryobacteraceae bacterium]|nr:transglutaminase family protein [Bryobacteraceae bacterium]